MRRFDVSMACALTNFVMIPERFCECWLANEVSALKIDKRRLKTAGPVLLWLGKDYPHVAQIARSRVLMNILS